MRYAAIVEYDGSHFNGWQRQAHAPSVQSAVEAALAFVADESVRVYTAGRTDTGVHAVGQVIHFDTEKVRSDYSWLRGTNTRLPNHVAIKWIQGVPEDFHARFSARKRRYRYIINTGKAPLGLFSQHISWYPLSLNMDAMREALEALLGEHDFSAFRASGCQSKNPRKTMYTLELNQQGDWLWLDVLGDGFLHHMVRNIVGLLLKIGTGERPVSWANEVLESRDRGKGGVTARPNGLYFVEAYYDSRFGLPVDIAAPRFW